MYVLFFYLSSMKWLEKKSLYCLVDQNLISFLFSLFHTFCLSKLLSILVVCCSSFAIITTHIFMTFMWIWYHFLSAVDMCAFLFLFTTSSRWFIIISYCFNRYTHTSFVVWIHFMCLMRCKLLLKWAAKSSLFLLLLSSFEFFSENICDCFRFWFSLSYLSNNSNW